MPCMSFCSSFSNISLLLLSDATVTVANLNNHHWQIVLNCPRKIQMMGTTFRNYFYVPCTIARDQTTSKQCHRLNCFATKILTKLGVDMNMSYGLMEHLLLCPRFILNPVYTKKLARRAGLSSQLVALASSCKQNESICRASLSSQLRRVNTHEASFTS